MMQNNCKVIGITGGISSGKSAVSNIVLKKGYKIIDADKISREVVKIGNPAYIKIIKEFGNEILLDDKNINRKMLGSIIFNNNKAREKLNNITHPYIFEIIKFEIEKKCKNENILFLDIPLLFEQFHLWEKYNIEFDEIILVYINEEMQIKRLMKRDNISKIEVLKKIKSQISIEDKKVKASKIIDNSGDIKKLKREVEKLLLELI